MAHELEVFEDGTAAFFGANQHAWHRLGTVTDGAQTAEDALKIAYLGDWNLRKSEVTAPILTADGVTTIPVPDIFAVVRDHPKTGLPEAIGAVGNRYEIIPNEAAFQICNDIVDQSGAIFETAGSLFGGRKVFVTMRLPQHILIGGQDAVDMYLLVTTSHDGSSNLQVATTPVRVVCQNTLSAALRGVKRVHKVRHTKNAQSRIQEARDALGLAFSYADTFVAQAEELISTSITDAEVNAFLTSLLPLEPNAAPVSVTKVTNQRAEIKALYNHAATQQSIKGTRWGAYNAVAEYADYLAPVKGGSSKANRRAERVLNGDADEIKDRALGLLVGS